MFFTHILFIKKESVEAGNALVNASASWCCDLTGSSLIAPDVILSRMKWQSISICFVRSWKIGLFAICIAARLSQYITAGVVQTTWKSIGNCLIQITSLTVAPRALYSASAEEREMVVWHLDFQETNNLPMKMQKPVVDFLVSMHDPQSASEKAQILMVDSESDGK